MFLQFKDYNILFFFVENYPVSQSIDFAVVFNQKTYNWVFVSNCSLNLTFVVFELILGYNSNWGRAHEGVNLNPR